MALHFIVFSTNIMLKLKYVLLIIVEIVHAQNIREDLKSHPNWKLLDQEDECGHSFSNRIIGGTRASLGQYPWIVRLGYSYGVDPDHVTADAYECGGTIISDRYILTAAHCGPETVQADLVQIRLGEYDASTDKDCMNRVCAPPVQDIEVEEYKCHPSYNKPPFQNDICLIRLAEPIKRNDYVQPICLPVYDTFQKQDFAGTVMEVAGWGITDTDTRLTSNILMTLRVPVSSSPVCSASYLGRAKISDKQMCAGGIIGKDSCMGDSGGPLMKAFSMRAPPRYFVVGVVSFGAKKCAGSTTPGVYTRVSKYMTWILDNVRE